MISNYLATKFCLLCGCIGIVLAFVGICTAQSQLGYSITNILGLSWYLLFYAAVLYCEIFHTFISNRIKTYRLAFIGFLAAFLVMVPKVLESSIFITNLAAVFNGTSTTGHSFYIAGLLLMICPIFILILVIGVERESEIDQNISAVIPIKDGALYCKKEHSGNGKGFPLQDLHTSVLAIPLNASGLNSIAGAHLPSVNSDWNNVGVVDELRVYEAQRPIIAAKTVYKADSNNVISIQIYNSGMGNKSNKTGSAYDTGLAMMASSSITGIAEEFLSVGTTSAPFQHARSNCKIKLITDQNNNNHMEGSIQIQNLSNHNELLQLQISQLKTDNMKLIHDNEAAHQNEIASLKGEISSKVEQVQTLSLQNETIELELRNKLGLLDFKEKEQDDLLLKISNLENSFKSKSRQLRNGLLISKNGTDLISGRDSHLLTSSMTSSDSIEVISNFTSQPLVSNCKNESNLVDYDEVVPKKAEEDCGLFNESIFKLDLSSNDLTVKIAEANASKELKNAAKKLQSEKRKGYIIYTPNLESVLNQDATIPRSIHIPSNIDDSKSNISTTPMLPVPNLDSAKMNFDGLFDKNEGNAPKADVRGSKLPQSQKRKGWLGSAPLL